MTLLGGWIDGMSGVASAFSGGMICLIPNAYFVWRSQWGIGGRRPRQMVMRFYQAEAGKFGLTVALFGLVFITVPPSNLAFFFSTYAAVLFTHWLAPWLIRE